MPRPKFIIILGLLAVGVLWYSGFRDVELILLSIGLPTLVTLAVIESKLNQVLRQLEVPESEIDE